MGVRQTMTHVWISAMAVSCGEPGTKPISDASLSTLADAANDAAADWQFVSNQEEDFALGDYGAGSRLLAWDGDRVRFDGNALVGSDEIGVYVSPLFDTGSDNAHWETLSWIPVAPYDKPLVNLAMDESGYLEGAVDMAANILLLHLDESSLDADDQVSDTSGLQHHGIVVFDGHTVTQTAGEFAGAFDIARDAWVSLAGEFFDFEDGDFTYSIWVKMRPCSESNDNRIAMGGEGSDDGPHLWLGASCPSACSELDGAHMNFLDSSFTGRNRSLPIRRA